jgi:hypothetical protein
MAPPRLLLRRRPAGRRAQNSTRAAAHTERYEDSYGLYYVRGPEGIIIELAERIG